MKNRLATIIVLTLMLMIGVTYATTEVAMGEHGGVPICPVFTGEFSKVTWLEKPAVRNGKVTMMWEVNESVSFHNGYTTAGTAGKSTACRLVTSRLERDEGLGWVEVKSKPIVHNGSLTRGFFRDRSMPSNATYDYRVVIKRGVEVEGVIDYGIIISGVYVSEAVNVFNYIPTTPYDFEATAHGNDVDLDWTGDCNAPYFIVRWEGVGQPYTDNKNSVVIEGISCSQQYTPEFAFAKKTFYLFMISPCPVVSFAPGALACDYARNWTYAWTITP